VSRAPIPNRKIERSGSGGAEVAEFLAVNCGVCRELRSVDAVEVVEAEGREIFGASGSEFVVREIDGL